MGRLPLGLWEEEEIRWQTDANNNKTDACDRLLEIDVADAEREELKTYLVSQTNLQMDLVTVLFESFHLDDIFL